MDTALEQAVVKLNCSDLIVVRQLPIIEERLKVLSEEIDEKLKVALSLPCSDENVQEIKKIRADLNKESALYEKQRKIVKNAVMEPYNEFEQSYKKNVKDKYALADIELKNKITEVQNAPKKEKENAVREYFDEYLKSKGIDFVSMSQAGINITLGSNLKSLKSEAKVFIDRIAEDLALIETQEHKTEILIEYKKSLNCSEAVATVNARRKAVAEAESRNSQKTQEAAPVSQIAANINSEAAFAPPQAEPPVDSEILKLTFSVWGTKEQLRAIKEFLINGGYRYE